MADNRFLASDSGVRTFGRADDRTFGRSDLVVPMYAIVVPVYANFQPTAHAAVTILFFMGLSKGRRMQGDFIPSYALQARVSYELGGRVGMNGTHWTDRARVLDPHPSL